MKEQQVKQTRLKRRIRGGRKNLRGTPERPRLSVSRSNRNIEAQIIDDAAGKTLCAVSTGDQRGSVPMDGHVG